MGTVFIDSASSAGQVITIEVSGDLSALAFMSAVVLAEEDSEGAFPFGCSAVTADFSVAGGTIIATFDTGVPGSDGSGIVWVGRQWAVGLQSVPDFDDSGAVYSGGSTDYPQESVLSIECDEETPGNALLSWTDPETEWVVGWNIRHHRLGDVTETFYTVAEIPDREFEITGADQYDSWEVWGSFPCWEQMLSNRVHFTCEECEHETRGVIRLW